MSDTNYTVFNAMVDIVASPSRALDEVRERTSWLWWPLLINIAVPSIVFAWYYSWVDFEWLVEETIRNMPAENRAEAADGVRAFMSPATQIGGSIIGIVVVTLLIYTIQAAWLHLANRLAVDAYVRYRQWFSFSVWTAFVGVFGSVAMAVVILMADSNQLTQADLSPLSMNALFIHAEMGDPWFTWGSSLTLINFWMLGLMVLGFHRWTGASWLKSAFIAILPWAALFGIWAALI